MPFDFSASSITALKYAKNFCKKSSYEMSVVHVVNEESVIEQKTLEVNESVNTIMDGKQVPIHVIAGDITTDISSLAKELNSKLIIIGTHVNSSKGISHLFGSHTMKVIISTHIPFIVVHPETAVKSIENYLLLFDESIESLECVPISKEIAQYFDAKIHIVSEEHSEKSKRRKVLANTNAIKHYLEDYCTLSTEKILNIEGSRVNTILEYSSSISADIIACTYDSDRFFPANEKFINGLIFNKDNTPILVMNSKSMTIAYS